MTRRSSPDDSASEHLAGKRVLVAEDDADNQKIISMMLGRKGASATAVANASELRRFLQDMTASGQEPPDAVILDWNLAGSTGDQLLEEIRTLAPELEKRVLVVTGDILRREQRKPEPTAGHGDSRRHGPPVLLKPFSPADLIGALSELLKPPDQG
jgi:CheY-like chemotaxis protein